MSEDQKFTGKSVRSGENQYRKLFDEKFTRSDGLLYLASKKSAMEQPAEKSKHLHSNFGFYIALSTAIVTTITFAIAVMTPPLSGPWCQGNCYEYPFTDIASRFPRDYIWMYPAMLVSALFVMLLVSVHQYAEAGRKVYTQTGLSFGIISATVLILNYFIQVSVIQPSLVNGETEGISLFSQFNPHGIFIASEEIGFFLMTLALFAIFPAFSRKGLSGALRIIFISGFSLAVLTFGLISYKYGLKREYIFEIAIISIAWLELITSSILLCIFFRRT